MWRYHRVCAAGVHCSMKLASHKTLTCSLTLSANVQVDLQSKSSVVSKQDCPTHLFEVMLQTKDGGGESYHHYLEDKAEWEKEELLLVDEVQHHGPIVQIVKGHVNGRMFFLDATHGNTWSTIISF